MAKPKLPSSPAPSIPSSSSIQSLPVIEHTVRLAHPEELPPILTAMHTEGWQIITIVHCRHSNEHAAYFRRN